MQVGDTYTYTDHWPAGSIPGWLAMQKEIPQGAKVLFSVLTRYPAGELLPTLPKLAQLCGVTVRQASTYLTYLKVARVVEVQHHGRNGFSVLFLITQGWLQETQHTASNPETTQHTASNSRKHTASNSETPSPHTPHPHARVISQTSSNGFKYEEPAPVGEAPAARCPDSPPLGFTPQQWQAFVSLRVRCGLKGDVTDREQRLYASLFAQGLTAELLTADLEAWLASEGRKRIHSMVYFAERLRQVIADPATEPATPEPVKELPKMGAADKQPLWGCWFKFAGEGDWVKADAQWVWAAEWYRKRGWADEDIPAQLIADLQGESQWRGWRIPQRPADVPLAAYQRTPGGASLLTDYPVH